VFDTALLEGSGAVCLVIRGWSSHSEWCFEGYVGRASLALSHGINGAVWYL
jgi:hypothetical protein